VSEYKKAKGIKVRVRVGVEVTGLWFDKNKGQYTPRHTKKRQETKGITKKKTKELGKGLGLGFDNDKRPTH
jgi:hypothetical protein